MVLNQFCTINWYVRDWNIVKVMTL